MATSAVKLGTIEPSLSSYPRFLIKINDDDSWTKPLFHLHIQQLGLSRTSLFTLNFGLRELAKSELGSSQPQGGSKLESILKEYTEPHRDLLKVFAGFPSDVDKFSANDLTPVFDGVVDWCKLSYKDDIVTIQGRDMSAILMESFTHKQFRNSTVADAVKFLANKHELQLDLVDPGTKLGDVYGYEQIDFEHVPSHGYSDWDLLTRFADFDGYVVFVSNGTLHYRPIEKFDNIVEFKYGINIDNLEAKRNFSVATSRIGVEFVSHRLKDKDSILVTSGTARSAGTGKGDSAIYRRVVPNADPEALGLFADVYALYLAEREKIVTVFTTGHPTQILANGMRISNTGSTFDGDYRMISIEWTYGTETGWHSEITALRVPPGESLKIHRAKQRRTLTTAG